MKFIYLLLLGGVCAFSTSAKIVSKSVEYKDGDATLEGYLAYDDAGTGARPGVLIVHQWMGLTDYEKHRAEMLAQLGYVAFCADIYGKGIRPKDGREAGAEATKYKTNRALLRERVNAGLSELMKNPLVDKSRVAAIGYCFGGSTALQLAYSGADLKAVVTFHAALPAPTAAEAKQIKATILVCHGADDKFIPDQAIKSFRNALDKASVKYEFVSYPDTVHSFTVPGADKHNIAGMKYNKTADEDSWKRMVELLAAKFKS